LLHAVPSPCFFLFVVVVPVLATRAHRELQNFPLFGKPLRLNFAKQKSDVVSKADGSFQPRPKRKGPEDEKTAKKKEQAPAKRQKLDGGEKKKKVAEGTAVPSNTATAQPVAADAAAAPAPAQAVQAEPPPPPHRILFVENLPPQANDLMLGMLFQQYAGYVEARVISGRGVAFVEFKETFQATTAMEALQGFKITNTHIMKITYAKK